MSVSESQTNVVYKVDNRTGPLVDVKKWLDDQELEAELNLRAECNDLHAQCPVRYIHTLQVQDLLVAALATCTST